MKAFYKTIYFCCTLVLIAFGALDSLAQEANQQSQLQVEKMPFNQWTNVYSNESVEIWIQKVDCIDPVNAIDIRKLIYRVVNKSNDFIAIQWDQLLDFGDRVIESSDAKTEYRKRFALRPRETLQGDCAFVNNDKVMFVKMLNPADDMALHRLQLLNVNIYR